VFIDFLQHYTSLLLLKIPTIFANLFSDCLEFSGPFPKRSPQNGSQWMKNFSTQLSSNSAGSSTEFHFFAIHRAASSFDFLPLGACFMQKQLT